MVKKMDKLLKDVRDLEKETFFYCVLPREIINATICEKKHPTRKWLHKIPVEERHKGNKYITKYQFLKYIYKNKKYNLFNSFNQILYAQFALTLRKRSYHCSLARKDRTKREVNENFVKFLDPQVLKFTEWHHIYENGKVMQTYFLKRENVIFLKTENIYKRKKLGAVMRIQRMIEKIDNYFNNKE